MPLQNQEERLAPKLKLKATHIIPDGMRGFLGASLVHETMIENQKIRQQHRKIEHDFYEHELPLAVTREKEIAAEAVGTKVDVMMNRCVVQNPEKQNQRTDDFSSIPRLKSNDNTDEAEEDQYLSLIMRSASPINNATAAADHSTTTNMNSSVAAASIMAVKNATQHRNHSSSSSSPPRHLHLSHSHPRLSPFPGKNNKTPVVSTMKNNNRNKITSSTTTTKNNNNHNQSEKQKQLPPLGTNQRAGGLRRANSAASSLSNNTASGDLSSSSLYKAAGVSKEASNALVRQLELLRLRSPTPTLVDDVREAFQSYNGNKDNNDQNNNNTTSKIMSSVLRNTATQNHLRAQSSTPSSPSTSSFKHTKCTVISNNALVGESVQEHHESQSRNRERRSVFPDHRQMTSTSTPSTMMTPQTPASPLLSDNDNDDDSNLLSLQEQQQQQEQNQLLPSSSSMVYSTHEQRLDAVDDNGELCVRLRHDISHHSNSNNQNGNINYNSHLQGQQQPSSLSRFTPPALINTTAGNSSSYHQKAMPLKFVQF